VNSRPLRSAQWFKTSEYYAFARRAWLRSEGFTSSIFDEGKPVIGIANS
jgi:L-arabonate dehydrase